MHSPSTLNPARPTYFSAAQEEEQSVVEQLEAVHKKAGRGADTPVIGSVLIDKTALCLYCTYVRVARSIFC